jgi:hypothetical protein
MHHGGIAERIAGEIHALKVHCEKQLETQAMLDRVRINFPICEKVSRDA